MSTSTVWTWKTEAILGKPAVVFDLDGVLSDAAGRQHYLEPPAKDWEAFFAACGDDPLIEETARLLELLDSDLAVVLLTARPAIVQEETVSWLERHKLRWDLLVMRSADHRGPSVNMKRAAVTELREQGFNLVLGLEDDSRNVEMLRRLGIPVLYVHSGYYS